MNLGTLRYDKLFDYGATLSDKAAGDLVKQVYKTLETKAHVEIKARNWRRIQEGRLSYPYFLVGLMPNSIHS